MAYIGKSPAVGNFVKLDAISTSSTNTYNLTVDSVAFVPESANHMLVSLNGVIQAPLSSFSVSGSTITFIPASGTLSSSDSIDFIMVYGNVLDIGTPSDATVTNAKTNFVSTSSSAGLQIKGDNTTAGTLQLNCEQNSHGIKLRSPAHSSAQSYTLTLPATAPQADKALITDGSGNLSFGDAGGGKLLQIIHGTDGTLRETTSTSFASLTLNASITPSATSSKVFVMVNLNSSTAFVTKASFFTVYRDSSNLGASDGFIELRDEVADDTRMGVSFSTLDSPSSTSALSYTVYGKCDSSGKARINDDNRGRSTITLMEIGA